MRPLLSPPPHLPNVRVHSHVSLFRRKFWASKSMYRGSAAGFLALQGFCVNPGIPPQKKVTTHIWSSLFGSVAYRRLSSSEGAPAVVWEAFCPNRGLGDDTRPKSGPYLLLFLLLHGGRSGSGRPRTTLENILPQERYQLVSDLYLQCLTCATQMHIRR